MKSNRFPYLLMNACAGLALTASSTALAEEKQRGPYVGVDLGPALTEDATVREFPGAGSGGKVEFDTGVRLSAGGGFRFTDWFRAGGETGFILNGIDGADATLTHVPILANVEFQLPNKSPLVPFVGGGPGFAISTISFEEDNLSGGLELDGSASDAVFAWQLYGGLRWKLNERMSLGAVYKYFEADSSTWDVDGASRDIRFNKIRSHAVNVSFAMDF